MHRRLAQMGNGSFGAAVFDVGMGLPDEHHRDEIQVRQVPTAPQQEEVSTGGILIGRLMSVFPASPELKAEQQRLIAIAHELGASLDVFVGECRRIERRTLKERHAEIRKQGKAQTARLEQAEVEFNVANTHWNNRNAEKAKAIDAVQQAQYHADHLGRWASDAEIDDAAAELVRAHGKADDAVEKEAAALRERNEANDRIVAATKVLNTIASEEIRIRAALRGEVYVDPEIGLSSASGAL
jgi:hypothetical protein